MKSNSTIATYDAYGAIYDAEVIEFWEQFPAEILKAFTASLPGPRVLNLGSGSGRDAVLLRDRGLEVMCVDASKTMIAMTRQLGFESLHAPFDQLDFPPESFDGVWAYTSLIHIEKPAAQAVIRRAHRWLKPSGSLLMGAIAGTGSELKTRSTMPGHQRFFQYYTRAELTKLVTDCGFTLEFEQDYQPHKTIYINQLYRA